MVHRLTKYAHFVALSHPFSVAVVAHAFLDNVYKLHGLPNSTVSDRDRIFVSTFWQKRFKMLGTKLQLSMVYHLESDGQNEVK